jgi:hypothetical protein
MAIVQYFDDLGCIRTFQSGCRRVQRVR